MESAAQSVTITELSDGAHVTRDDIEVVQPEMMRTAAEEAKFMNEFVVVYIQPDDDPNSPEFLYSGNQGVSQWIHRGTNQRIRRKYLYSMIAAKKTQFACAFGKDNSGNEFNRMNAKSNPTYRLSVVKDTPEGMLRFAEWMQEA